MKFLYKDFVKSNTYVKCKHCHYEIDTCSSCENLINEVQTIYCFINKKDIISRRGEYHLCEHCWELKE